MTLGDRVARPLAGLVVATALLLMGTTLWLVLLGSPSARSIGSVLALISAAELALLWAAARQHRAATATRQQTEVG